jgi:hypothetical protein
VLLIAIPGALLVLFIRGRIHLGISGNRLLLRRNVFADVLETGHEIPHALEFPRYEERHRNCRHDDPERRHP